MTSSFSSYMTERAPDRFGGRQSDYVNRTQALIAWGGKQIQQTAKDSLATLFFTLLENFQKERQAIAREHGTPYAEQFGRRRDKEGIKDFYHTYLDDIYQAYNPKILKLFSLTMQGMPIETKNHAKQQKKIENTYLGYTSSFEVEIFEIQELDSLRWRIPISQEELPKDFPVNLLTKREQTSLSELELQSLKNAIKLLKQNDLNLYKRLKMANLLLDLQKEFPSPLVKQGLKGEVQLIGNEGNLKSFFALGTSRLLVNGKMYAMTQYLTWLYRDFQQPPIDRMLKYSTVMVIHQDNFLIDETLQEIALLFANAVLCETNKLEDLQAASGLFRHYFANCMPTERGSASIGEWLEGSIYHAHGYKIKYNKDRQIDLEALTTPLLSDFIKDYPSMLTVEPIKPDPSNI
ncbi:hypothetical protein [Candidatus Protochlamydia phocaeensis]|uniref:hypothetical protein n=1 Tax=Candidatus Protochlamydia phocaeensis TaxID=1414722 RepID=UPI0008385FD2|nr:hypothetical protein [Candidatus Protochlamydia phocaeensis]